MYIHVLFTVCVAQGTRDTHTNTYYECKSIRKHWGVRGRERSLYYHLNVLSLAKSELGTLLSVPRKNS